MTRVLAVCLAVVATPALAEDVSEADVAIFLAAFAENGCAMAIGEAQETLTPLGIEFETADMIAGSLMEAGQATVSSDYQTLTLSSEICP
jgi:hypothetical protein